MTATDNILRDAAKHSFAPVGEWLAVSPQEVNAADEKGWTVLHHAAAAEAAGVDVEDTVSMLLQAGANPHLGDTRGDTPFNIAAPASPIAGRLMTLHWLEHALNGQGSMKLNDRSGSHGSTLSQYMAKWLRVDEIDSHLRAAVAAGLQVDVPNAAGWTPVTAAAAMGRAAVVEAFIWHYGYDGIIRRTTESYTAQYGSARVTYAAGLTAAEVAYARLAQDKTLTSAQKRVYAKVVAFILLKISGV